MPLCALYFKPALAQISILASHLNSVMKPCVMKRFSLIVVVLVMALATRAQDFVPDRTIKHVKATVQILGDGTTAVLVPDDNKSGRYLSTQLPEDYKKEGLKVTISGVVGKIPPNFRMMGTPLKLTCICVTKAEQQKFKLKKRKYTFKA